MVKCINKEWQLTKGETYIVIEEDENFYYILNNRNESHPYPKSSFITTKYVERRKL